MANRVRPLKVHEVRALRRQFIEALNGSFSYIEPKFQRKIRRDNNTVRLLYACLHPHRVILVATDDERLYGYVIGGITNKQSNLYWLYVEPNSRSRGIGLDLLRAFERHSQVRGLQRIGLSTYEQQGYYEKEGYTTVKEESLHGVPMKIMVKDLHQT